MSIKFLDPPESHKLKVYVSSTSNDLKEYRDEVIKALEKKKNIEVVCMEKSVAESRPPLETCLEDVDTCDIYVGIFARRYGDIPRRHKRSFTELEYRTAVKKPIHTLIFMLDEKADWPPECCDGDKTRIDALRKKLKRDKTLICR